MFFKTRKERLRNSQVAFNRMNRAFEMLLELRDQNHDIHDAAINEVKNLLEAVISQTVPLPAGATEKDYYAKMIEYVAIYKLSKSIIN